MTNAVRIQLLSGAKVASIVDAFYEREGKSHRARPSDLFFVAVYEDIVVGLCRFCVEEGTPLLRSMVVHSSWRSRKIGSRILDAFVDYLKTNRIGPTYCIPYDHLGGFYGQIGFKVISEKDAPVFLQERIKTYRKNTSDKYMLMRRD